MEQSMFREVSINFLHLKQAAIVSFPNELDNNCLKQYSVNRDQLCVVIAALSALISYRLIRNGLFGLQLDFVVE